MAKKKTISENQIITYYMDYVLEHNENPKSVYAFAKANNFEESKFYAHFASFDSIEKKVFKSFLENTVKMLERSEEYTSFDARNKLLGFYYTFFENLTANRSYVVHALQKHKHSLKGLCILSGLKKDFSNYVDSLEINKLELKDERLDKVQASAIRESAWIQLLLTIKFWMDDTSAAFEKTDIFIEKSVNTSFDVINVLPLKSMMDFGKFIFKEKFYTSSNR